jgi:hypothetical protein
MPWFDEQAKTVIQIIARGVEFAGAVIIGLLPSKRQSRRR